MIQKNKTTFIDSTSTITPLPTTSQYSLRTNWGCITGFVLGIIAALTAIGLQYCGIGLIAYVSMYTAAGSLILVSTLSSLYLYYKNKQSQTNNGVNEAAHQLIVETLSEKEEVQNSQIKFEEEAKILCISKEHDKKLEIERQIKAASTIQRSYKRSKNRKIILIKIKEHSIKYKTTLIIQGILLNTDAHIEKRSEEKRQKALCEFKISLGNLGDIPQPVLFIIFSHFSPQELCIYASTSKAIKTFSDTPSLWKMHLKRDFPSSFAQIKDSNWKETYKHEILSCRRKAEVESQIHQSNVKKVTSTKNPYVPTITKNPYLNVRGSRKWLWN